MEYPRCTWKDNVLILVLLLGSLAIVLYIGGTAMGAVVEQSRMAQWASDCRKFHMMIQEAVLDDSLGNQAHLMWPADAGITSAHEFLDRYVKRNYITEDQAKQFNKMFLIGNVSAADPGDTILFRSKPGIAKRGAIVLRKTGEGQIISSRQTANIRGDPPRNPPYLAN
jgi:hypothetical protein